MEVGGQSEKSVALAVESQHSESFISLGKGKGEYILVPDVLNRGTFGEVVLEITVPCPNGTENLGRRF